MDINQLKTTIMKTNYLTIRDFSFGLFAVLALFTACKKIAVEEPSRLFRPTLKDQLISEGNYITASWQDIKEATSYIVQISRDTFRTIDATMQIDTNIVTFENLKWNQSYQVQVRANAADTAFNSRMSFLGEVKTPKFPTILNTPGISDVTDEAVRVSWATSGATVTSIKILKGSDSSLVKEAILTPADITNRFRIITGLKSSTEYIIYLYSGTSVRGWDNFTTKAPLVGAIVDLRNVTDRPTVLYDTLPTVASGSIVLLKRGENYTIPASYTFDRTVTIMSESGFNGGRARISLTGNFDATGNIDSLRFEDLVIVKDGSNYFMNVGNVTKIGALSFVNCRTEGVFDNSFIRLKTAGDEVSKLTIDNCVIDSFGVGAKYPIIYAGKGMKFTDIKISNSTFHSIYYFIRQDNTSAVNSAAITDCTFNDFINQGGYFINYTTFPSMFTITNTIFGKTKDTASSNGIKSSGSQVLTNCYSTTDCIFSANPITGATAYSGTAADLFKNPLSGDFTIKDNSFSGKNSAGDPRWK